MKKVFKKVICTLILFIVIVTIVDYNQTIHKLRKPIFAQVINSADDGGSGTYIGIGYSVNIKGDLTVEHGYKIERVEFSVLGLNIGYVETD